MNKYAKAITAVILGVLVVALKQFGITPDSTVSDLVSALVIAGSVYFVPNKK